MPRPPRRQTLIFLRNSVLSAALLIGAAGAECVAAGPEPMAQAPQSISAPDLNLPDLEAAAFSLHDRKGRFILVNFWALWCAPCRIEMPALGKLQARLAPRGLRVVAVNLGDKRSGIDRFLKQVDVGDLAILLDADGVAGRDWHVGGLPATYLVGPTGEITHAALGAREWADDATVSWFENILASAPKGAGQ